MGSKETEAHKLLKKRMQVEFERKGYTTFVEVMNRKIYCRSWVRVDVVAYSSTKNIAIEVGSLSGGIGKIMNLLTLYDKVIWQPYVTINLKGFKNTTRVEAEQQKRETEDFVKSFYEE